jgi:O-antigen ligase
MWVLTLFDPGRFLDAQLGVDGVFSRVPTLLVPLFLLVVVSKWRSEALYWPFALFVLLHVLALPFVDNRGRAQISLECLYPYFLTYVGTISLVDTPRKLMPILVMFVLGFAFYGVQVTSKGLVPWQTAMDENGFGALMVLGVAFAFPFARAARRPSVRALAWATAGLGIAGTVISFARGAFLALVAVAAFIWLLSPRKLTALLGGLAGVVVLLVVIQIKYPGGTFWQEISTVEDAAENREGQERWVINRMAFDVFKSHPLLGVGPNNFGPVAARTVAPDNRRSSYRNPGGLYGRTLHNDFLQVLVEGGIVGFVLYMWMMVDFFRRTRSLRRPSFVRPWRAAVRGQLELPMLAVALEAAMIAYVVTALVYPQLYFHWFYSLVTLAGALVRVSRKLARAESNAPSAMSRSGARLAELGSRRWPDAEPVGATALGKGILGR